jgi:pyruvate dehydrogenase E1 component alpha subunit
MPAWSVDGMDVLAVEEAATAAVAAIRAGSGPYFLELQTYRYRAHSMYDPERYRDKAEVERWKERDPIDQLAARLPAAGQLDPSSLAALDREVAAEVDESVAAAEVAPLERSPT